GFKLLRDIVQTHWICNLFFFRGKDVLNQEMLTQGFTHVFSLTFASSEDLTTYMSHERHQEFAGTFMAAIDKVVVVDFPVVASKPAPPAAPAAAA
ncbi:Os11g0150400, partial [Oryza sativa Japonica Group]